MAQDWGAAAMIPTNLSAQLKCMYVVRVGSKSHDDCLWTVLRLRPATTCPGPRLREIDISKNTCCKVCCFAFSQARLRSKLHMCAHGPRLVFCTLEAPRTFQDRTEEEAIYFLLPEEDKASCTSNKSAAGMTLMSVKMHPVPSPGPAGLIAHSRLICMSPNLSQQRGYVLAFPYVALRSKQPANSASGKGPKGWSFDMHAQL